MPFLPRSPRLLAGVLLAMFAAITYSEYGTGDVLFTQKNKDQAAGAVGCQVANHTGSPAPGHINGYNEPSWINGGSKPNLFPLINFPQVGIRYKPVKQIESRLGGGISLTGFWFGLSVDYGLEKPTH